MNIVTILKIWSLIIAAQNVYNLHIFFVKLSIFFKFYQTKCQSRPNQTKYQSRSYKTKFHSRTDGRAGLAAQDGLRDGIPGPGASRPRHAPLLLRGRDHVHPHRIRKWWRPSAGPPALPQPSVRSRQLLGGSQQQ